MSTTQITAYLARIHMLILASLIEKDHPNQKECEGYVMSAMDLSGKLQFSRNSFVPSRLLNILAESMI